MTDRRRRFEAQALPHLDAAHNLARWLARPPVDADDIVQEAMLRAYRAFDTVRGEDVKPWLLTIVRNCFLTAVQQTKRRRDEPLPEDSEDTPIEPAFIAGDPDPETTVIQMDTRRQLDGLLATLPDEFREVLVLREMEDLSYSEIAQIAGIPIGTVMSRLARARALLKKIGSLLRKGAAMSCSEGLRLQAYFDGELDASAALEIERHLENCANCASLLADLEAARKLIRQESPYHRVDAPLRKRVTDMLDREEGVAPRRQYRFGASWRFLSSTASGAGAMALAAAVAFFLYSPQPDLLVGDLMNAHLRSLMSDHMIDVVSSDRHTVKPWFAGHTDVSPPAPDFSKEGYKLIGGRADYVDGHRAAVVVYRHGAHIVNIFAWAAGTEKLPDEATQKGYHIACWRAADLDYCAVSDTGMDELLDLVRLMKQQ